MGLLVTVWLVLRNTEVKQNGSPPCFSKPSQKSFNTTPY